MIQLTRINRASLVLNSELIEHIETTPDTVISLTNGQKFVVLESAAEVMEKIVAYQRRIRQGAGGCSCAPDRVAGSLSVSAEERADRAAGASGAANETGQ